MNETGYYSETGEWIETWKCARCNHENIVELERCESCQLSQSVSRQIDEDPESVYL